MSRQPGTTYPDKRLPPAIRELQTRPPQALPVVERLGSVALYHTALSRRLIFASGAEGYTLSQVHIEGDAADRGLGRVSLQLPAEHGNVLIVPRHCLIDTRIELTKHIRDRIPFDGRDMVQGIMQFLYDHEVGGVRYDACLSYARNAANNIEDITFATAAARYQAVNLRLVAPA
ncbi:MAG TPA: hypothetical protein VFL85_02785 [Candidatus Saccharimonadales bacterium]|nr:hypothetical protein [Candidatus Saccharimonadales bacterium]